MGGVNMLTRFMVRPAGKGKESVVVIYDGFITYGQAVIWI